MMSRSARTYWAALGFALALYLATMAPGVSWGDSGEAQVHTAGRGWLMDGQICRSHVVYFALCRALDRWSPLSPAVAANVVAAFFGAVTVANAGWLMSRFCRRAAAVVAGVGLLALSHTLWQMSAAAEVVTLSTALLTAELAFMVVFLRCGQTHWLAAAALCNGLGVSTHNMAMLTWPAYVLLAAYGGLRHIGKARRSCAGTELFGSGREESLADGRDEAKRGSRRLKPAARTLPDGRGAAQSVDARFRVSWRGAIGVGLVWLIGLAPMLALCVDHYQTHGDVVAMLRSATIGSYGYRVFNVADLPGLAVRSLLYVGLNFPTPLLFLALPGAAALWRRSAPPVRLYLVAVFAAVALFVIRYNVPDQYTFFVHTHVFVALACAAGIDVLLTRQCGPQDSGAGLLSSCAAQHAHGVVGTPSADSSPCERRRGHGTLIGIVWVLAALAPLVYGLAPPMLRVTAADVVPFPPRALPYRDPFDWFIRPWRINDDGAERYAREVLQSLPPEALLWADSTAGGPIQYLQSVEGFRRDVRLDGFSAWQSWLEPLDGAGFHAAREQHLDDGTYFSTSDLAPYLPLWLRLRLYGFRPFGHVFKVVAPE